MLRHRGGEAARGFAGVEFARAVLLQAREGGAEVGLDPRVARGVVATVVEVDRFRGREGGEQFFPRAEGARGGLRDDVTLGSEAARGFAHLRPRETTGTIFLQRQRKARNRAGHAARAPTDGRRTRAGDEFAVGVEIHVARRTRGRGLAVVDDHVAAIGEVDEHETAAADIAGERINDAEGEAGGDGGVHGIAALAEHLHAGFRSESVRGGDEPALGFDGFALRAERDRGRTQKCEEDDSGGEARDQGHHVSVRGKMNRLKRQNVVRVPRARRAGGGWRARARTHCVTHAGGSSSEVSSGFPDCKVGKNFVVRALPSSGGDA